MVIHSVPAFIQHLFPARIWRKNDSDQQVYLTFDDGPVPGVTDFVLNELAKRSMKATFFMVGANVQKNPFLGGEVVAAGQGVGNHTQHHLNGWNTALEDYIQDFKKCDQVLKELLEIKPALFRPPYGKLKGSQAKEILKSHELIMWNVLSGDYDPNLSPKKVISNTLKKVNAGSIIVLHDQQKTKSIVRKVLPEILDFISDSGYQTALL